MARNPDLQTIFEHETTALLGIAPWLDTPVRWAEFLHTYHDKIRRKARLSGTVAARYDLLAELAVGWLLLRVPQFAVEYEKRLPDRKGGPDFTAVWKTHTTLHVEVKRLRPSESATADDHSGGSKWNYAICDKLRQVLPGDFNAIALVVEDTVDAAELVPALKRLKLRAEQKDEAYFKQRGLAVGEFFTFYGRLNAVVVCGIGTDAPRVRTVWFNKDARRALPPDLQRSLAALDRPG